MRRSISVRASRCGRFGLRPPSRAICWAHSFRTRARFGFDLTLPVFFTAMLVGLWRGSRRAIGWAVAGVVALAAAYFIAGWWFIVIGAVAGSIVGGFVDDAE